MNNCRAKAQRRDELSHSLVGQDVVPVIQNFNRNRRRSDISSTGRQSSLSSSIDTFFSGAWSSVSDFFDDISEKGENAMKDFKRMIHLNVADRNREERRRSAREKYKELYSRKLQFTSKEGTIVDKLDTQECPIAKDTEHWKKDEDVIFGNNFYLNSADTTSAHIVNNTFENNCKKSFESVCDDVQRWFSSNRDSQCSSQVSVSKNCYKRRNSDHLLGQFSKSEFCKADTTLLDATSLQTLHSEDLTDTFKLQSYFPIASYDDIEPHNEREKTESTDMMPSEESQISRNQILDDPRREKSQVGQGLADKSPKLSPPRSVECSEKIVKIEDNASSLGTINLVIEYIALSNILKLTVEGICLRDNVPGINKGSSIFIKVYMTLKDEIKKTSSKAAKQTNLMSFYQEMFLEIDDPESANLPLLRLIICKRKTLFGKYRFKPIAETLFYVNKEEFDGKLELSKLLTVCS